jgi:hypothetical protein
LAFSTVGLTAADPRRLERHPVGSVILRSATETIPSVLGLLKQYTAELREVGAPTFPARHLHLMEG